MSSVASNGPAANGSNGANGGGNSAKLKLPTPGPFSVPETEVSGHVLRVDTDGFGIVAFDHDVGMAQLGFFTAKTELLNWQAGRVRAGAAVNAVVEAVEMEIPTQVGPLALPLKSLEPAL